MSSLNNLLASFGSSVNTASSNTGAADELALNFCCDVVLAKNTNKYILGTNQLFPIHDRNILNGGIHDIQLYVYSALKWRDLVYTENGTAIHPGEDPDIALGYNCGTRIFKYKGGTPCLARHKEERPLTVDEWCRLSYDAIPTDKVFPRLWKKAPGGHLFWTPDEGIISALPVDIPMALDTVAEFKRKVNYGASNSRLETKVHSLLYSYMLDNSLERLYIGYSADVRADMEEGLIPAYEWSKTHRRRLGEIPYNYLNLFGSISDSNSRKLANAINSSAFVTERVFA